MAYFQTESLWINKLSEGVGALVLDVPNRKVNVFNRQVFDDFERALDKIEKDQFELLLIRSGKKRHFCSGADLRAMSSEMPATQYVESSALGQRVFQRLVDLPTISIAVISGACLGGGLELALASDYRVVVDQPTTQIGFPELEVGLIPGWGGTQRLPRLIGIQRSLPILLGGRRLNAGEALAFGLADDVVEETDEEPPGFLQEPAKRPITDFARRTWRHRWIESNRLGRWLIFRGARRVLERKVPDEMPAPWEAFEAVHVGVRDGMEKGLEFERAAIGRLSQSDAFYNLLRLSRQREQARKKVLPESKSPSVRRVGLVTSNALAIQVLQWVVQRGGEIVLREGSDIALGMATLHIVQTFQKRVLQGTMSEAEMPVQLNNIHGTTAWKGFADLDMVVETLPYDVERKRTILEQIEENVSPSTMLVTCTNGGEISQLHTRLKNSSRCLGLHFCHPAAKTPLVEVIAMAQTEKQVLDDIADWLRSIGKIPLVVDDAAGFVINRVMLPYWHEATNLLVEGYRVDNIDAAMHHFGMVAGPFEYMDSWGIEQLMAHVLSVDREDGLLHPIWNMMVESNWLGQKSARGFFRYRRRRKINHALSAKIRDMYGPSPRLEPLSPLDEMRMISSRLVSLLANEAVRVWQDGDFSDPQTLDWAMVFAGAFAPHRGGPFRYAMDIGITEFRSRLTAFEKQFGERYAACDGWNKLSDN